MQQDHLPMLGTRYWAALCLASIFGANMGDFFARNLGLGHVAGLPFLALALVIVVVGERFDRTIHQVYYWTAIIIVRTAATNVADLACGDLKLPRPWVIAGLTAILIIALLASWQLWWRRPPDKIEGPHTVLRANLGYWVSMFIAGTLGTVIGDYCSHDWHFEDAEASILLGAVLAAFFLTTRDGLLRSLPYYWLTVVAVRAAGTVVGDFFAGRNVLGLPLSTLTTGVLFVALLALWKQPVTPKLVVADS